MTGVQTCALPIWVIGSYEKIEGRDAVALGDGELGMFAGCMEGVLRGGGEA